MKSQCYSWITHLYNKLTRNDHDHDHYDDETSILLKKRPLLRSPKLTNNLICEDRPVILSYFFDERPLILRYLFPKYLRLFIIDGNSEKECNLKGVDSSESTNFVACIDGLVLLSSTNTINNHTRYTIFNPLHNATITTVYSPVRIQAACGFFFHPLAKEYRILAVGENNNGYYEYQIYSLKSKVWRKIANPNFRLRPRNCWKSEDLVDGDAAIVNGALHWYVSDEVVMVFDMISEEISLKLLPFKEQLRRLYHFNGFIRRKGEELCFCAVVYREPEAIHVWGLREYEKWRWSKKFVVDLMEYEYPLMEPCLMLVNIVSVVGFYKDEMVVFWRHRGLFLYNLESRSVQRIWNKNLGITPTRLPYYDQYCGFASYF
ncbi:hypothetical protein C2S51_002607 [Perilla frutescens var. frutescens]|nr:hypothetical protein C2S51_002607 [Perilla frutescens var. frutescens]